MLYVGRIIVAAVAAAAAAAIAVAVDAVRAGVNGGAILRISDGGGGRGSGATGHRCRRRGGRGVCAHRDARGSRVLHLLLVLGLDGRMTTTTIVGVVRVATSVADEQLLDLLLLLLQLLMVLSRDGIGIGIGIGIGG